MRDCLARFAKEESKTDAPRFAGFPEAAWMFVVLLLGVSFVGCFRSAPVMVEVDRAQPESAQNPRPWFKETAAASHLNFKHSSGASGRFYIPEMMSGGVGLLDYDRDGRWDVFCVQAGSLEPTGGKSSGNKLYRNLANGQFEDVTERAGVAGKGYGMGCACADFDADGDTDIYVTCVGPNILFRNNGDGTFSDVTAQAGVGDESWGASAAFFDYDADGFLDLFVANYIKWSPDRELECYSRGVLRDYCSPMNYQAPAMDTLYHNKGDGTFENVTVTAGLTAAYGNGLGVTCADFNHDGRLDIYVANDAMPNQLWINQGNGKFVDEAMIRGCAVNSLGMAEAGMGVVAVDLHPDGWFDLFMTHLVGEANRLYLNTNGYFIDRVDPKGPGVPSWPFTGFGVGFADFDHDGIPDLFVANGRVKYGQDQFDPDDPYAEPNHLLRGLGNLQFQEIPNAGLAHTLCATSRGAAFGDLDNDGDIDVVVVNKDGPVHLLENCAEKQGNWIMFRVLNRRETDALGALVQIESQDVTSWRQVQPNEGYCSSNDPRIHFGLGPYTQVDRVIIQWPDNSREIFGPFSAGRLYELRPSEGAGVPSGKQL